MRKLRPKPNRLSILMRKYGYKCYYCAVNLNYETATKDHLIPISRGGRTRVYNMAPSCGECNGLKGALGVDEFKHLIMQLTGKYVLFYGELKDVGGNADFLFRLAELTDSQKKEIRRLNRGPKI